jgi:hypothetical protein
MDKLQTLIRDVRVLIRNAKTSLSASGSVSPTQAKARGKVKEQLQRSDLRVSVEVSLVELLHQFDGFDLAGDEQKAKILDDSEKLLGRIESLIETDSAINADRIELPQPPEILAPLVEKQLKEERLRLAEIRSKELQKRQDQISEPRRRPNQGPKPGGRRRPGRGRGKPPQQNQNNQTASPQPKKGPGERNDLRFQKQRSGKNQQNKPKMSPRRPGSGQNKTP